MPRNASTTLRIGGITGNRTWDFMKENKDKSRGEYVEEIMRCTKVFFN